MNKEFSNIIIFNNNDIVYVKEKLEKMIIDLGYNACSKDEAKIQVDILQDKINNIGIISSNFFSFKNSDENKSIIRKIAKRLAQDSFMATASADFGVIEKYSFNKRTYDYIFFGNEEELEKLGYDIDLDTYLYQEIWKNHFVGRNTIADVDKIIKEKNTYFGYYEIIIEILKLYGIKPELTTYKLNDIVTNNDIEKEIIYFK